MNKFLSRIIRSNPIGQLFRMDGKDLAWQKVRELKAGMRIAVTENQSVAWDEIVSIKKLPPERVWDIEVEGAHNFVGNGIVAHNTSGLLMRAGAASLQLSSSATSTTADIQLAAADRIDLFAGSLSLQTSSTTAGELKLMSKGSLILDTSGGTGDLIMTKLTTLGYVCTTAAGVVTAGGASCATSDIRLKTDIRDLSQDMNVLESLEKLRGVSFSWDETNPVNAGAPTGRQLGMIAQEVEQVLPSLVNIGADGYRRLDYAKMTGYLVEVAKEQQDEIAGLQNQLSVLGSRLSVTGSSVDGLSVSETGQLITGQPETENGQLKTDTPESPTSTQLSASNLDTNLDTQPASPSASAADLDLLKTRVSSLEDLVNLLTLSTSSGANVPLDSSKSPIDSSTFAGSLPLNSSKSPLDSSKSPLNPPNSPDSSPSAIPAFSSDSSGYSSVLGSLSVGGSLTVGLLTIDDLNASINSMGKTLKIQNQSLANVEFMGGKLLITRDGSLITQGEILAAKVTAGSFSVLAAGKTIGSAVIPAGEGSVTIPAPSVTAQSRIFTQLTLDSPNFPYSPLNSSNFPISLIVTKLPATGFEVILPQPAPTDITFDYWIVHEE